MTSRRDSVWPVLALGSLGVLIPASVFAQAAGGDQSSSEATVAAAAAAAAAALQGAAQQASGQGQAPTQNAPIYGGFVAPTPAGQPLGGGNATDSSSRPKIGDDTDSFDLLPKGAGGGTVHGTSNGPVYLDTMRLDQGSEGAAVEAPSVHKIRKGDTLWDICDSYFHNPYQWPRIWSYNPQIQNPHWIYPGNEIALRRSAAQGPKNELAAQGPGASGSSAGPQNLIDRRRAVGPQTIFLRDQGFVDDEANINWGEVTGSPEDKMFLTDQDNVYLRLGPGHDLKLGQEFTIYRPLRNIGVGRIVQFQGTVRVNQWDPRPRIARGQLVESLDVIERGARVGPIMRRFEVIEPVRNEADVRAHVIASIYPHTFFGQNQVVFLDKGEQDGLRVGNRLFIIRRGDAWRQSLATPGAATRIALESNSAAEIEKISPPRDERRFPEEIIGELRVIGVRPHTTTALVSSSIREIEQNDDAISRKGY